MRERCFRRNQSLSERCYTGTLFEVREGGSALLTYDILARYVSNVIARNGMWLDPPIVLRVLSSTSLFTRQDPAPLSVSLKPPPPRARAHFLYAI